MCQAIATSDKFAEMNDADNTQTAMPGNKIVAISSAGTIFDTDLTVGCCAWIQQSLTLNVLRAQLTASRTPALRWKTLRPSCRWQGW